MDFYDKILLRLIREEGYRRFIYTDTTGNKSIGYGHNLEEGVSEAIARNILFCDILEKEKEIIDKVSQYKNLNEARKIVLLDMAFNLGVNGLLQFKKMLAAISAEDFKLASSCMLDSMWARQVGNRAIELAKLMENGE